MYQGWGGVCHEGVGWVMEGWGGVGHGGEVCYGGVGWCVSRRRVCHGVVGCVMEGWGGVGCVMEGGSVMEGWDGSDIEQLGYRGQLSLSTHYSTW